MNDLRKAAEMALKFCDDIGSLTGPYPYVNETAVVSDSRKILQALRQALAEPEQEPVAWANAADLQNFDMRVRTNCDLMHTVPLYTAPPKREWVGLTDEDYDELLKGDWGGSLIQRVEAKLKEKNI